MATNDAREDSIESAPSGSQRRVPDLASILDIDTISALAIENSPFSVEDMANRDVSYVMLCEAGVSPLDADRLRRRYSLTWTFVWTEGAHLLQRAEQLRTLREPERAWIAASTTTADRQKHRARRRWREIRETADETQPLEPDRSSAAADGEHTPPRASTTHACPRCGEPLVRSTRGRGEHIPCACGGVTRLDPAHTVERTEGGDVTDDERLTWEESVRQFVAED